MKRFILTLIILAVSVIGIAQTTKIQFYKDKYLSKAVSPKKAKFSESEIQNTDGSTTVEVKDLKKNIIIKSETTKGIEPFGIWIQQSNDGKSFYTYDYNFTLNYTQEKCKDSIPGIRDYFKDDSIMNYKAPRISSGEFEIINFLSKELKYPDLCKEMNIQGVVYLSFVISENGTIENIVVTKSAHVLLDKESVRVLRKLKFSNPPTINGQSKSIRISIPIGFRLK